ncbi:unnamed protein product [Psylliodes chrysocephalus]|uniref:TTF-type domain-containing protein n=1 Tax=Psylliodes chrysocephalus TaxID=3402493 RepID=A0A9P0CZV3_9CUCU|nr:unnamed protein product [Psylliodes chrysocephala]
MKKISGDIRSFFLKVNKSPRKPANDSPSGSVTDTNDIVDKAGTSVTIEAQDEEPQTIPKQTTHDKLVLVNDLQVLDDLGTFQTGPRQPILEKYPSTKVGIQNRSFSAKYFKQYGWVEYSINMDAIFCFCCRIFGKEEVNEPIFTKTGFKNWKKIAEKLSKHSEGKAHIQNNQKYVIYKETLKAGSVATQTSSAYKEQIIKNKEYFKIISDVLLTLCRQGIALRGHDESEDSKNKGNFKEICELVSRHNPLFKEQHTKYFNLTSSDIQNDIINIIGNMILNTIIDEIKECGMYALMVDEARSFKEQQLSVCVRYVKGFQIEERFLGFTNCSQERDATSLCNILLSYLKKVGLTNIPIIAQSYDGASVMSGRVGGLQAKIRERHPSAIYIHCMAHRLNLVVTDLCSEIDSVKDFFNTVEALYVHFSSPGNHSVLIKIQKELGLSKIELNRLSDTRWSCRNTNCQAVKKNYSSIINALQFEIQQNYNKNVVEAVGLLSNMKSSKFLVSLIIIEEILTMINILSKQLQSENGTMAESTNIINGTIKSLEQKRDENVFARLWLDIEDLAKKNDIGLDLRSSKRKKAENVYLKDYVVEASTPAIDDFKETLAQSTVENPAQRFWLTTVYYRSLDHVINHMKIRFSAESQKLAVAVHNFLQMNFDGSMEFIQFYADTFLNIDKNVLKAEMTVIRNCIGKEGEDISISDITSVVTKTTFPNSYRFLQIALTLPISSASCEAQGSGKMESGYNYGSQETKWKPHDI